MQVGRLHVRRELGLQLGFIDAGCRELLDELLAVQARGLFLQLQFVDAVAQRLQRTLGGQAGFVGGTQLGRQIVQFETRSVQRFFLDRANIERVLQTGMRGLLVDRFQLGARIFQRRGHTLALLVRDLDAALQFVDAVRHVARGEARVGGGPIEIARLGARGGKRFVERFEGQLVIFETRLQFGEFGIVTLEVRFRFATQSALLFDLRGDFFELFANLRAALRVALMRLRELEHVHLQGVHALRRTLRLLTHIGQRLRGLRVRGFGTDRGSLRLIGEQGLRAHLTAQVFDFLLTGQHAGLFGIGGIQLDADARHDVAGLDDERAAFRQLRAHGERLLQIVSDEGEAKPVIQHGANARVVDTNQRQQRTQAGGVAAG